MPVKSSATKVECLNPNTGGKMNIEKTTYDLFSKAIHHTLKKGKALTYTQLAAGVHEYFNANQVQFEGSVEWYTVSVKNDMEARGVIEAYTEKGKKLNRLAK